MSTSLPNFSVPQTENKALHLSNILDSLPAYVFYIDNNFCFQYINKAFELWMGLSKESITGLTMKEVLDGSTYMKLKEFAEKALSGININFETELPVRNGLVQFFEITFTPEFEGTGLIKGFVGYIQEQDKKKESENINLAESTIEALEKEVKVRTKELQLAYQQMVRYNSELEQFAYAASHDLQEPLRKIQTFANMLSERNYNELNEVGKNYVSRIIKSSERMSDIINDLLYYSRQSRIDGLFEETDLNLVVENVLCDLELMIHQKGAIIECEELPCIKAIPSQMNRLFHNLINNSLKFSLPDVPPRIKISVKDWELDADENNFIELMVEDNGIGFEQKYAERIFQLFQRLNDKYSFGGNGIGLALCKKIIQNHNGQISAESEPNKGSTFHIKLPINLLVEERVEAV